jgi:hypothetical protein
VVSWFGAHACVFDCAFAFLFTTLDLTVDKFGKEESVEEFEEVQGQIATQGKPPLLVAYLNPSFIYASLSIYVYSRCIIL